MTTNNRIFNHPFKRPWMKENCAAAATGGTGLKGIIAGEWFFIYPINLF